MKPDNKGIPIQQHRAPEQKERKKRFETFAIGIEPPHSNVRVLDVVSEHRTMLLTVYRVELICCGKEREFNHHALNWRCASGRDREEKGKGKILCHECQRLKNAKRGGEISAWRRYGHGSQGPDWPVPPMALEIHKAGGWEPR